MYRISFEGIDGSGKSTQARMCAEFLKKLKVDAILYHEPRILRDKIKRICKQAAKKGGMSDDMISYYFSLDGLLCREEELKNRTDVVIRDRDTAISQYAYHKNLGTADGTLYLNAKALSMINGTDLIIFIDVPIDIAFNRIISRGGEIDNYFERKDRLVKCRNNYLSLFGDIKAKKLMGLEKTKTVIFDGEKDVETLLKEISHLIGSIILAKQCPAFVLGTVTDMVVL